MAVASQTPLVRFKRDIDADPNGHPLDLNLLKPGEDWTFTAGGVTRMLKPLLESWSASGFAADLEWVALQRKATPPVAFEGFRASFVSLTEEERNGYVKVKEALWSLLNRLPGAPDDPDELGDAAWGGFRAYAKRTAKRIADVEPARPFDAVYVHDFQLAGLGRALADTRRAVFHLHTPFPENITPEWARFFERELTHYEDVIVSTRAYAKALRRTGYGGPIHVVYPFVDPRAYPEAESEDLARFRARYGIAADDHVILNVARMDPMKSQDRLIRALPRVLDEDARARLVLVGNGSFSSSTNGGLGLSKGARWRKHLEKLAADLDVSDRVTFTGHLDEEDIPAAFSTACAFALPSQREGFGLAVIEAWLYGVPVIVSDGAGVRELVVEGENGFVVDSEDEKQVAKKLLRLLDMPPDQREAFAESGRDAAHAATLPAGRARLEAILKNVAPPLGIRKP